MAGSGFCSGTAVGFGAGLLFPSFVATRIKSRGLVCGGGVGVEGAGRDGGRGGVVTLLG